MRSIKWLILGLIFTAQLVWATPQLGCNTPRYAALFYVGNVTKDTLGQVIGMNYSLDREQLLSVELTRTFPSGSGPRQYFGPVLNRFWLNLNLTYHRDPEMGPIYEIAPFISGHWQLFHWQDTFALFFAVGEGVSYVSNVPSREFRNSDDPVRFLNYLMFEFSCTSPKHPELEFVMRIHHRSGVFGLYNANNSGATAVGVGLRYFFWPQ